MDNVVYLHGQPNASANIASCSICSKPGDLPYDRFVIEAGSFKEPGLDCSSETERA